MNRNKLIKLTLTITVIGIFSLLLFSQAKRPVSEGKVQSIETYEKYARLFLENDNQTYTIFINPDEDLQLQKNQWVIIYGIPEVYKNKQQIIVDKIESQ